MTLLSKMGSNVRPLKPSHSQEIWPYCIFYIVTIWQVDVEIKSERIIWDMFLYLLMVQFEHLKRTKVKDCFNPTKVKDDNFAYARKSEPWLRM